MDKGCFVLTGQDNNFNALCPEARAKYCRDFSTAGRTCPGNCGKYVHGFWDKMEPELRKSQLDYVESNKSKVRFNAKSFGIRKNIADNKRHLLSDSGEN